MVSIKINGNAPPPLLKKRQFHYSMAAYGNNNEFQVSQRMQPLQKKPRGNK